MILSVMVLILIMLLLARLTGEFFERIKYSPIIGEILIGIALGPYLINLINPARDTELFTQLSGIAEIALFFHIVDAGLELSAEDIKKALATTFPIAFGSFIIPFLSASIVGLLFKFTFIESLFLGLTFSLTALPVAIRVLSDLGLVKSQEGHSIISTAIVCDISAMLVLSILVSIGEPLKTGEPINIFQIGEIIFRFIIFFAILGIIFYLTKIQVYTTKHGEGISILSFGLKKIAKLFRSREPYFAVTVLFILGIGALGAMLGLDFIIGAFFGSIFISREMFEEKHYDAIEKSFSSVAAGFLTPLFFIYIGLLFNLDWLPIFYIAIILIFLRIISKYIGAYLGSSVMVMETKHIRFIGIGVALPGTMELIVAKIGLSKGLISTEIFSLVVVMVITVIITTSLLLKRVLQKN